MTVTFDSKSNQQTFNAEEQLLLCCSRTNPDSKALNRIRTLATQSIDWKLLLQTAALHGVLPLLHLSLRKAGVLSIPSAVWNDLGNRVRGVARHNFFLMAELIKLTRDFENHGIASIAFKGPVLAACAYGDVTLRQFGDLDIAVRRDDIPQASKLILSHGYQSTSDGSAGADPHEVEDAHVAFLGPSFYYFCRPDGRSDVDLQWRVAEEYFSFSLDREDLWRRLVPVSVGGKTIQTFAPTNMLLILCVHGSKHRWEKLKWVCDVAELVRAQKSAIDWEQLRETASLQRVQRMVSLGLFLAEDLLEADLPEEISQQVRSDRSIRWLARRIRQQLLLQAGRPPGKLNRITFYLRAKDRWQDRVRFCLRYTGQAVLASFVPTSIERTLMPLPRRLSFLYFVIRPARLLRKYGSLMLMRKAHK